MNAATRPARSRPPREVDIGRYVRERPITSLMIAAGAGFVLGGGANSRPGRAVAGIVGPMLLRSFVTSAIVELVSSFGADTDESHDNGSE